MSTVEKNKGRPIKFIRKSNNLVEGRYRFDIWEMRIFVKMLTLIMPTDEDFKRYRISLKDIISDFDLEKNNRSYEELKKGAEKLASREIRIPMLSEKGEAMELFTHIASGVKSFVDSRHGKYIEIDFHPDMKPYLLQLQNKFLMYDARNILKLPSSFSIRIYELLKQYESIGKRRITVGDLKEMLDIDSKYTLYANLKQRVILKAQNDLECFTDIKFAFKEIKQGKSVIELVFYISKNANIIDNVEEYSNLEIPPSVTEQDVLIDTIFNAIKQYKGSTKYTVENWIKKHSIEHILSRINFVNNQISAGKIVKNPMGLLQKVLNENSLFDPIAEDNDIQKKENQKRIEQTEAKKRKVEEETQMHLAKIEKTVLMKKNFLENTQTINEFLLYFKHLRSLSNPNFMEQLAINNYLTSIPNITPYSSEEIKYNFLLGGSFSALILDWMERKSL